MIRLDLLRDGIVLQEVKPLPPDRQRRLLPAIYAVTYRLGFEPSLGGDLHELPLPGAVLAVHLTIRQFSATAGIVGEWAGEVAAEEVVPSQSIGAHVDNTILPTEAEIDQDDDGLGPGM